MFSTLSLDGSNRIVASELVLINSTEPSTLSSVYATNQELADTAGSLGGGYTIEEVDVLILAQKNKIDANILDITELNATSTTMFNEKVNQNATITSNFNNITAHGLTITSILPTISANTIKLDSNFNNISSNTHLISNLNASITSHISLIDTNINNITGHGNTITTILTDIANLQAGGGASWTTTEKTTIQADVSTLYANDTNLFNTNTAYSNTFASIISDNNIQDLLITQNSNTINSLISADLQKLDKTITTAQTMNSPLIISLTDNTNPIFRIQDAVSNQRLEFKRGCQLDSYQGLTGATPYRLWLGWNTGDVIIGRPNNASIITINGNVHTSYNFAQAHGTSYFEGAVYMKGNLFTNNDFSTDIKTKIDNLDNALTPYLETHTPAATEGFYIHHPNFVACSIGDITNSSNQYFMCDGAVSKTIFNKPVDVLGDVYTNGDLTMVSGKKVEVNQVQSVSGNTLLLQNSPSGNVQFGNTSKLIIDNAEMYVDTNDLIIRNSNTSNSINLVVGLSSTYADNKIILNSGSNSELRGDWTIDGDMTFGIAHKINLRHLNSDAVLRLEASTTIDSYIDGTKYLQLDDTQFSSYNGFNLSSDKRLKDNIEDVDDDTINMVKNIKIKTFVKNQKTKKTELGWIAQDVQQYTNPKYNIVNDTGEYLTMCYDRMACISWDALTKLIARVEYLENEVFKKKNKNKNI